MGTRWCMWTGRCRRRAGCECRATCCVCCREQAGDARGEASGGDDGAAVAREPDGAGGFEVGEVGGGGGVGADDGGVWEAAVAAVHEAGEEGGGVDDVVELSYSSSRVGMKALIKNQQINDCSLFRTLHNHPDLP